MANVAEGFDYNSVRNLTRFLDYLQRFITEAVSHSSITKEQAYIKEDEMNKGKLMGNRKHGGSTC
jgi:hypothetical protein